jgi:putative hydrolase
MKYEIPIVLSSDSHGVEHIGDFTCAAEFVHEMMFSEKMILNNDIPRLKMILSER